MNVNSTTSLARSFVIQRRVIFALLMREIITRYGRHNIGFMWLFLEPMLFTLGVTTLWTMLKLTHGSGYTIAAFAVTGYSSILLWRNCSNRVVGAIGPNLSLMHHRNVRVIDIYISRLILEIAGASTSLIVLTLTFSSIGWMNLPDDVLVVAIGWFLLAWFAVALSLIVGAASERSEMVERVWHIMTYLMFPLSGAAFLVDWFPTSAQKLMLLVPMVHGTEMIRHGFFGAAVRTHEDPIYLLLVNIVMTFLGLALVRETGRRLEQ
ncbi:ABC transporter permease [Methylotenera sp.]|uniref:ABC transporter permease n=1 Tax=Methylotenera sp. TaxID=2051956 RepID=UPI00248809C5|nr:ABC transporter permease [Methylotenera sp.]MDI1298767.1 ABC transporter permease [Methylotenera sp.]